MEEVAKDALPEGYVLEWTGTSSQEQEAARLRFRAVMMTALSFILGVLPLAFASGAGAASRMAIGWVVLGGMLLATVIGIFFIPALFVMTQSIREKLGNGKTQSSEAGQ